MSWWFIQFYITIYTDCGGENAPVSGLFQQVVMYLFQKYMVS